MFLLDTNVVSEPTKPQPNAKVLAWLKAQPAATLFLSVVSLGEIVRGLEKLPSSKRKQQLAEWVNRLPIEAFGRGRLLPVDQTIAYEWGRLDRAAARTVSVPDALLAATARVHGLAVATRNERHFADLDVRVINPWLT